MRSAILIFALCACASLAQARELYPGQWAQASPDRRDWFSRQVSPKTGGNCCSSADGVYAEEDIRGGHYWTRFVARYFGAEGVIVEVETDWMEVPDDVILQVPNPNGSPVVWWFYDGLKFGVRCYSPGPKL